LALRSKSRTVRAVLFERWRWCGARTTKVAKCWVLPGRRILAVSGGDSRMSYPREMRRARCRRAPRTAIRRAVQAPRRTLATPPRPLRLMSFSRAPFRTFAFLDFGVNPRQSDTLPLLVRRRQGCGITLQLPPQSRYTFEHGDVGHLTRTTHPVIAVGYVTTLPALQ